MNNVEIINNCNSYNYNPDEVAQIIAPLRLKTRDRLFVCIAEQVGYKTTRLDICVNSQGQINALCDFRDVPLLELQRLVTRFFDNFTAMGSPARLQQEQHKPSWVRHESGHEYLTKITYEWKSKKSHWLKASLQIDRD